MSTSYVYLVCHIAILSTAKQLPSRGRQPSCSNEVIADAVLHSDWSSAVHGLLAISRRSLPTRGCQPYAGRSLHHIVTETTIRAANELLYMKFRDIPYCSIILAADLDYGGIPLVDPKVVSAPTPLDESNSLIN